MKAKSVVWLHEGDEAENCIDNAQEEIQFGRKRRVRFNEEYLRIPLITQNVDAGLKAFILLT